MWCLSVGVHSLSKQLSTALSSQHFPIFQAFDWKAETSASNGYAGKWVFMLRGVDNFLEVGGLKTVHMKFLHYHAHFCMTTPPYYNVCQKIWFSPPSPPLLSTPLMLVQMSIIWMLFWHKNDLRSDLRASKFKTFSEDVCLQTSLVVACSVHTLSNPITSNFMTTALVCHGHACTMQLGSYGLARRGWLHYWWWLGWGFPSTLSS